MFDDWIFEFLLYVLHWHKIGTLQAGTFIFLQWNLALYTYITITTFVIHEVHDVLMKFGLVTGHLDDRVY